MCCLLGSELSLIFDFYQEFHALGYISDFRFCIFRIATKDVDRRAHCNTYRVIIFQPHKTDQQTEMDRERDR